MKKEKLPRKVGRPTKYSQELADNICSQLAMGLSLRTVCKGEGMPAMETIFSWFRKYKEFSEQYAKAKEESADALFEETIDIADDSLEDAKKYVGPGSSAIVNAYRLKVDTRKWMMSKMKPKKYGDKLDMTTNGKDLPTPILNGAIHNNNSNEEGSQS